ncbi:uncharacterized protein METZ01_LOCUS295552, partial [marine metagenome]
VAATWFGQKVYGSPRFDAFAYGCLCDYQVIAHANV